MILLNKHSFSPLVAVSKEESRYTLNAIHITPEYTEATNGFSLVRVTHPDQKQVANYPQVEGFCKNGATPEFLLGRDTAVEVSKAIPREKNLTVLNHAAVSTDGEQVTIATTDLESPRVFRPKKIAGNFPATVAVIPPAEAQFVIHVDASLLAGLAKAAAMFTEGQHSLQLSIYGPEKAIRLDAHNLGTGQHWLGILMPRRGDVEGAPKVKATEDGRTA